MGKVKGAASAAPRAAKGKRRDTASSSLSPEAKGKLLERAVRSIEELIVRAHPAAHDATIEIQPNKRISVDGVRSEIDLWIRIPHELGYDAIFIFECKNRSKRVSKNEILVFSALIRDTNAQRGFFIARAFGRDAIAQAARDPRIEIRRVEIDESQALQQLRESVGVVETPALNVAIACAPAEDGSDRDVAVGGDAVVRAPGFDGNVAGYLVAWAKDEQNARDQPLQTVLPHGGEVTETYTRAFSPGECWVEEHEVRTMTLTAVFRLSLARIVAVVQVHGRGRALHFVGGPLDLMLASKCET